MSHINNETLGFVSRFGCSGLVGFNRAHGRKSHERKAIINGVLTTIRQAPRCHAVTNEIIISHATSKYLHRHLINSVRSGFGRDSVIDEPKPRLIYGLNLQRVHLPSPSAISKPVYGSKFTYSNGKHAEHVADKIKRCVA